VSVWFSESVSSVLFLFYLHSFLFYEVVSNTEVMQHHTNLGQMMEKDAANYFYVLLWHAHWVDCEKPQ
jgi:hypothetical protein